VVLPSSHPFLRLLFKLLYCQSVSVAAFTDLPIDPISGRKARKCQDLLEIPHITHEVRILEPFPIFFSPVVSLFNYPVFYSSLIPPNGSELEVKKRPDCQDDPYGQAEGEHDHKEAPDGEGDLGFESRAVEVVPRPVEAVPERHGEDVGGLGAPHHSEEQETDEVAVVEVANAVIDPRAMVVHFHDAMTAFTTVVSPGSLVPLTSITKL